MIIKPITGKQRFECAKTEAFFLLTQTPAYLLMSSNPIKVYVSRGSYVYEYQVNRVSIPSSPIPTMKSEIVFDNCLPLEMVCITEVEVTVYSGEYRGSFVISKTDHSISWSGWR
jgi:hypothetical protein